MTQRFLSYFCAVYETGGQHEEIAFDSRSREKIFCLHINFLLQFLQHSPWTTANFSADSKLFLMMVIGQQTSDQSLINLNYLCFYILEEPWSSG